ncbi:MAG TPA: sulfotransferase [Caulobacteraceae bacterium]|jgi:tetratricopeptide (TPR) repeat protein
MRQPKALRAPDEKPRWQVQFDRAVALCSQGASRKAVAPLRAATDLNPGLAPAWRLLGDILTAGGDFRAARQAYDRGLLPMIRDVRLRAAAQALADDHLAAAERALRDLIAHGPAVRQLLGEALFRQNRLDEAESALRTCLGEAPDFQEAHLSLARLLLAARRFPESLAEFDALLAADPTEYACLAMKAAALTEIGRYAEAAAVTAAMLEQFPDQPYAWLVHANGLRTLGQSAACVAAYDKAIELDPRCAEAYLSLANLKTYRFPVGRLAAIGTLLSEGALPPEDQARLHFVLGKEREDAGAYAGAFDHYARGNAIERARRAYDPAVTSAYVRKAKALFTKDFFAKRLGWGAPNPDPVFIVGLPRSGSTLVEQILASHPAVEGTHELADLPLIAAAVRGYPESLASLSREACARMGGEYLRRTSACRNQGRPRFVDKTPSNFLHVGLIQLILPRARIVDVRRHPLACGLSIFKQHFGHGFGCAFDLDHIGRYYADYVDLMAHFDLVLPGRVHRVIYEHLVADTEGEIRALLDYLDLPFDRACLRFFENRRAVDTPSSEQVRQPIFTDALDHWRHFDPWLDPLRQALGSTLQAYPAAPI